MCTCRIDRARITFYGLGSDLKIIIFVPLDPNPESVLNFGFGSREAIEYGSGCGFGSGFGSTSLVVWMNRIICCRTASYYFVIGVDRYHENKFEDSVELLTTSYIVNEKLLEETTSCKFPAQKVICSMYDVYTVPMSYIIHYTIRYLTYSVWYCMSILSSTPTL